MGAGSISKLAAIGVVCVFALGNAFAQDEQKPEKKKQTTMSETVFKRLSAAHEDLGEGKLDDVLSKLKSLEKLKLNEYEQALIHQTYGFVYVQQSRYDLALQAFERCLALDALPERGQQGMLYSLASLYLGQEEYQKTIDTLDRWFPNEPEPKGDGFIMMASALTELGRHREAIPQVQEAIKRADKPKEPWYQLWLSNAFELEDYSQAASVLQKMVALWPDKPTYWEMLSGAYLESQKDAQALAAVELAYRKGLVTEEKKLLNIAKLHLFVEAPFEAGKLLAREIDAGRVEPTEKNLELLLQAWTQAKEYDKAIATIDRLAPMSSDGKYYLRQAYFYNEKSDWENVQTAVNSALSKGGLKKPGEAYVLLGLALTEQKKLKEALNAFREASKYPKSRQAAEGWSAFVRDQMQIRL